MRFIVSSFVAVGINFGGTWFLHEIVHLDPQRAFGSVLVIVYLINFMLVRYWVFVSLLFRCGEYLIFTFLYSVLNLYYLLAVLISLCSLYCVKFYTYRFLIFK